MVKLNPMQRNIGREIRKALATRLPVFEKLKIVALSIWATVVVVLVSTD